jgi:fermentation-respiration switch protein FrsA (DUF1100 family)
MRRRAFAPISSIVAALVVLFVGGCASVLDNLIFFPDRFVSDPPPGVEERWITTGDGVRLHAWYAPPADASAPVLVWSHGNGGNIANRAETLVGLHARGLGVLAYDYRGYGQSDGRPSEAGVYRDALAAYESERAAGTPPGRIVCFGESLGSAVTMHLAVERPCARVVVVSPFTTLADVARRHYGRLGGLAGNRFDALGNVARLTVPLLVVHGDQDEVVPFGLGERLFAAAPEPKRFLRVPGAHHNDVFAPPFVLDAIATFAHEVGRGG